MKINTKVVDWLSEFMKVQYCSMRLKKRGEEQDSWPPVKTKSYTTLALMYQKDLQTSEETTQTIFLRTKGDISDIPKKANSQQFTDIVQLFDCQSGSVPNCILIEGHPGIGKTTLVKEICIEWAEGKLLTSDKLVFLLLLRDPNVQRIKNIQQLIKHFVQSTSKVMQLHSYLEDTNGADVTLIIDGFDELNSKLRTESFFKQLLEKKVLPKTKIVVTSRPIASACLHSIIDRRVEILGFDQTSRKQYVNEALQDSPSKLEKLQIHFQQYPNIDAICYIPLLMSIIVFLCMCQPEDLPPTACKMYQSFVLHTICHYLKRTKRITEDEHTNEVEQLPQPVQQTLQHLGKLAFDSLLEDKIVFAMDEVPDMCEEDPTCYGLLQCVRFYCPGEIGTMTKSFNFLHLGIQEYFAATYVATLPESEVLALLKDSFLTTTSVGGFPDDNCVRLSNMWIMYCGVTSGQCNSLHHHIATCREPNLPVLLVHKGFLVSGKHDANSYKVDTKMTSKNNIVSNEQGSSSNQVGYASVAVSQNILEDPYKILYLYQCFQEAQDDYVCGALANSFCNGKVNISGYVLTFQLVGLGFFLSHSPGKWKELRLCDSNIGDYGIQILHHYLCGDQTRKQEIKMIDLTNNNLTMVSSPLIGDIISQLQPHTIVLDGNKLHNMRDISTAIVSTITVKVLNMSHTHLTSQDASAIRDMMSCLVELDISDNKLDDAAAVILSEGIKESNTLRSFLIHQNEIGALGAKAIADKLTHNTSLEVLNLNSNNIYNSGATAFAASIAINKTITKLYINFSRIRNAGAIALSTSLVKNTSLEVLCIKGNYISDSGASAFAKVIATNKVLKILDISQNKIRATGAIVFAKSLTQNISLERLYISNNGISQEGATAIAEAITNNATLKELELCSDHTIDEESYMKLLKSLHCNNSIYKLKLFDLLQNCDSAKRELEMINSKRRKINVKELECPLPDTYSLLFGEYMHTSPCQ
ncbi:protein NLRC3-like isoform X2 [Dysidea avara]|uniref:protein NLRC3-like isoform X2 n=1 Tax=Dysidea avara TaxID=196820 RepID=UPI003333E1C1